MDKTSLNITQDIIDKLKQILPQAFSENNIDFDKLKTILADYTITNERYNLSWAGKSNAYKLLQTPISDTLIPNVEQSIDWDNAQNIFIEGENLSVLKILQKSYYGKVKMIYIDPPYNTGSDSFIYPDKFKESIEEYLQKIGDKYEEGKITKSGLFRKNNKENGHYHSNWLNMMLPRLFLARNLLRDDGVIFISIDDHEQANLKLLCDEIFGGENFVGNIAWESKTKSQNTKTAYNKLQPKIEYVWLYTKNSYRNFNLKVIGEKNYSQTDENGVFRYYKIEVMNSEGMRGRNSMIYSILGISPPIEKQWKIGQELVSEFKARGDLLLLDGYPTIKMRPEDERSEITEPFWGLVTKELGTAESAKKELSEILENSKHGFETVKPVELVKKFIFHSTSKNDLILDFFSGSGTTAQAVMELNEEDGGNRTYICIQLDEEIDQKSEAFKAGYTKISDITHTRIKKVIQKIQQQRLDKPNSETQKQNLGFRKYTLADSNFKEWQENVQDSQELEQQILFHELPQYQNSDIYAILWELMLKNGIALDSIIKTINIDDVNIYYTNNIAFLLEKYSQSIQQTILALKPQKVIALDSIFIDDNVKTNASLKFSDENIEFETI